MLGPPALLYKTDLKHAFRNLRLDPMDNNILDFMTWRQCMFIDIALPFIFNMFLNCKGDGETIL